MMTLADLSKLEKDTLRKSVIDTIIEECPAMELIPWETIGALSTTMVEYQSLPSVGFRKVNEGYVESTGKFGQRSEVVSLFGLDIDTDIAVARAKNTIGDARAIQQKMALKAVSMAFTDKLINGDSTVDVNEFDGLAVRSAAISQEIDLDLATDEGVFHDTASENKFIDKLDELMYSIDGHKPDLMFMNKYVLLAIRSVLRRRGLLDTTQDMFGRKVDMYAGARLLDAGANAAGTEIILKTETKGMSTGVGSSIYAAKFSIGDEFWGIQEYALEARDLGEIDAKPVFRTRVDWPLGLAMTSKKCIGRLYGVSPTNTAS